MQCIDIQTYQKTQELKVFPSPEVVPTVPLSCKAQEKVFPLKTQ
jgi:hypothetical protein